ncbi:MAG TPA: alpha-2-macroglobulin family protein, partial [Blastocatellia bacterium]|nr:alpha-2-macroglobulin family protein [Blastocatellia bacterium]
LTQPVRTNTEGAAELQFTPERDGYYRVAWSSEDRGAPVVAETAVWVATNATTELGYRHGGVEIVVDKDTFHAGQKTPVMLTAPVSNRYILFSVEGDDLYSYQLVHLDGTAKLIELDISEKHVPNVFLSAAMVTNRQLFLDNKEVIVPPVDRFLTVDVKPDREQYEPGDEGTLTITARDKDGRPAAAEVGVGLVDDSVYYIQGDYAADPRQFYYGQKRRQAVQTTSTFNWKRFSELVEGENKQLVEKESLLSKDARERDEDRAGFVGGLRGAGGEYAQEFGAKAKRLDDIAINGRSNAQAVLESGVAAPEEARERAADKKPDANEYHAGKFESPTSPNVRVRSDFRSTVIWQPDVTTDAQGKASIKFKYPDSTTSWRATARAASTGSQFGFATATTKTSQPLIVRLQAPRFFLAGDLCTVSAVINNNTDKKVPVGASIIADGLTVSGLIIDGQPVKGEPGPIEIDPHGEGRVDWAVYVHHAGTAHVKVSATGGKHSDAMERNFPVYEHGIDKLIAKSGKLSGDEVTVKLDIPAERKTESTSLTVQVAPSMAVTMLDALPYLIDYPYGCTEQTMSRFLPAAITAKTLRDLGVKPEDVMDRVFGGVEPETAAATHPSGKKDLRKLDAMVKQGLERLYNFQHADGGWGWWKEGESDHFMTAYVLWGFTLARDAGIEVRSDVLERANDFLNKELVEEENAYDLQAWMLHALASFNRSSQKGDVTAYQRKAFDNLWTNRERLNAYTRALLALSAHSYGFPDRAKTLVDNLENGVKIDSSPDASVIERGIRASGLATRTAHWGEDGIYWRWSDGGVEATAFVLRALLAIDPQNKLVEPVTNWLVKNRRGAQWSNTRDTAITVLTLNDYLRASGELSPEMGYDLIVNNQPVASKTLTPADALGAPSRYAIKTD